MTAIMSEWVDIAVYAALIAVMWGWLPAWGSRVMMLVIADRNPGWIASHPAVERRLNESRWFRWSCRLWGSISVLALSAFQVGVWPQQLAFLWVAPTWEALRDLNSALIILGLLYVSVCAVLFYRWLHANVPISSRRQATLARRSLRDYVPRRFQYAVYAMIALHLALWTAVAVTGRSPAPAFWGAMAFQFVISGAFLLFAVAAVRRRPGTLDRVFGPDYRRIEVRVAFAAQLLPLVNGAARLYEHVVGASANHIDRLLHLGMVLFVVGLVTAGIVRFRQSGERGFIRWGRSETLAGLLVLAAALNGWDVPL